MIRQNVVLDLIHGEDQMKYRSPSQIGMLMNQLSVSYAGKARVYPIGETAGKNPLLVMEVSDDLETSHLKPAIKVHYTGPGHTKIKNQMCFLTLIFYNEKYFYEAKLNNY